MNVRVVKVLLILYVFVLIPILFVLIRAVISRYHAEPYKIAILIYSWLHRVIADLVG